MKHLKKFNEEVSYLPNIETELMKGKFTPITGKVSLNKLYSVLFIELDREIENDDGEMCKYMSVDCDYSCYVGAHKTLNDALESMVNDKALDYNWLYRDNDLIDWYEFLEVGKKAGVVFNLLDYNDFNYQEIENILMKFGLTIDNIWGLLK